MLVLCESLVCDKTLSDNDNAPFEPLVKRDIRPIRTKIKSVINSSVEPPYEV
jgi:hypothetical protein